MSMYASSFSGRQTLNQREGFMYNFNRTLAFDSQRNDNDNGTDAQEKEKGICQDELTSSKSVSTTAMFGLPGDLHL